MRLANWECVPGVHKQPAQLQLQLGSSLYWQQLRIAWQPGNLLGLTLPDDAFHSVCRLS